MDDQMPQTPTPTEAELARLADGSLPAAARESLRARAQASPELAAALREQERAVALMRSVDEIAAPASLRASIESMTAPELATTADRDARTPRRARLATPRWRRRLFMPAATALALVVAAVVVIVSGGGSPTVPQTAHLALSAATLPAPAPSASDHELLDLHVGRIPFPSYVRSIRWRASGTRRDVLHGRTVTTVFYRAGDGTRVGYAIVSGSTLDAPAGPSQTIGGVRYTFGHAGSAKLVTWWRDGHTCVIAGRTVGDQTLLALATADEHTSA